MSRGEHTDSPARASPTLVIHFGLSPAALAAELPAVLAGRAPASASSGLGTGNYQEEEGGRPRRPRAVVFGGAWDGADVETVRAAVRGCGGEGDGVVMLRHDGRKPSPPLGPAYGPHVVQRVKDVLGRLVRGEEVEWAGEGVVWY